MASQVRSVDNMVFSQWDNPDNAFAEDDLCTSTIAGGNQNIYNIINTPFTVPAGAIIEGIEVKVIRGGDVDDHYTIELQDKNLTWKLKIGTAYPATCAEGIPEILGTPIDDWGGLWDATHINSSSFQARLTYLKIAKPNTFNVDHVEVTVYYTVFAPSVGLTVSLLCHNRVLVANTDNLLYHSRNLTEKTNGLVYHTRVLAGINHTLIYHVAIVRIIEYIVELQFVVKEQIISFADKVTKLKFGRKET